MITVFTAIFGNYEIPRTPKIYPNIRYVLFSDRKYNINGWEVRVVPTIGSPAKASRHYKILSTKYLPDAEITVWHGGWLRLINDPMIAVNYLNRHDIAMEPHLERKCTYQEARACISMGKANKDIANKQMAFYRKDGFPANYGLTSAFLIVRKNTDRIRQLEELWWEQVEKFTNRDQLSLMYCMWKLGLDYDRIPIGPNGLYRTHAHGK